MKLASSQWNYVLNSLHSLPQGGSGRDNNKSHKNQIRRKRVVNKRSQTQTWISVIFFQMAPTSPHDFTEHDSMGNSSSPAPRQLPILLANECVGGRHRRPWDGLWSLELCHHAGIAWPRPSGVVAKSHEDGELGYREAWWTTQKPPGGDNESVAEKGIWNVSFNSTD